MTNYIPILLKVTVKGEYFEISLWLRVDLNSVRDKEIWRRENSGVMIFNRLLLKLLLRDVMKLRHCRSNVVLANSGVNRSWNLALL